MVELGGEQQREVSETRPLHKGAYSQSQIFDKLVETGLFGVIGDTVFFYNFKSKKTVKVCDEI